MHIHIDKNQNKGEHCLNIYHMNEDEFDDDELHMAE